MKTWLAKISFYYLLISIICAFFGAVYEMFSHGVYSYFMLYAFAFPLVGGALFFVLLSQGYGARMPGSVPRQFYHGGLAVLTVGSIMSGVLEIYGTTNSLISVYWYVGCGLCVLGALGYVIGLITVRKSEDCGASERTKVKNQRRPY
ncbi:hypothetical protein [Oscillibacter sp.]|uniref:hypothetical protein n=1 Tax=Oscillibacter sp. TaxID=1945593 RepID=UPI003395DE15